MSVRRLAKEQPASFAFTRATKVKANWWIAKYPVDRRQSAVIPILWLVQKQEGWVSEPAIRAIAELLGMPYIRVLEVATFYTMFMLEPVGSAALIQVCGTTPCMLRGAGELMAVCKSKIGPKDTLSADGRFTWQEVECLGACANAPMAQINDFYFEDLTAETMAEIIDAFAAGKRPKPGSRVGRKSSEPEGGALTLTDPKLYDGSAARPIGKLPNSDPVTA
jgi:NADH-quinone oxidoreductase subunit E